MLLRKLRRTLRQLEYEAGSLADFAFTKSYRHGLLQGVLRDTTQFQFRLPLWYRVIDPVEGSNTLAGVLWGFPYPGLRPKSLPDHHQALRGYGLPYL